VLARESFNSTDRLIVGGHLEEETPCACLGENKNLGPGSRGYLKSEITVLARASSNLTDWPRVGNQLRSWVSCETVARQ
jgi:hypothetical protein